MNQLRLIFLSLLASPAALAQGPADSRAEALRVSSVYERPLFQRPLSAGIHLGTQGFGASVKLAVLPVVNVRLGFSYLPASYNTRLEIGAYDSDIKLKGSFSNIHLLGEYRPFGRSSFRIVGGLAYFLSGQTTVDIEPHGNFDYGDIPVSSEELGTLTGKIDWKGIAPYLGIGLFNSMPSKKINVNLDLGTYYLARPQTSIEGTKMLSENDANEAPMNENLKGYRWLPVLQVNINYRIH